MPTHKTKFNMYMLSWLQSYVLFVLRVLIYWLLLVRYLWNGSKKPRK